MRTIRETGNRTLCINIRSLETGKLVARHWGETNEDCEAWAGENYCSNDYSWDYCD